MRISDKKIMYEMLAAGRFGNTIQQYFDVHEWAQSEEYQKYAWWGIRSLIPGGPCHLNYHREWVRNVMHEFDEYGYNISVMVDQAFSVKMWAEVYRSELGLTLWYLEYPPRGSGWRKLFPAEGKMAYGTTAKMMLKRHLNDNSYDDMMILLDEYDGHVVEFSVLDRCFGTVPHRNAIVWEVRDY